ncbi:hypothetical protein E3P99_00993 [Wallemia hederae]|uniref:NAD(P)-binding protein n=1 Tax=Wallemia hederae TaxID=1540922 RepID=A0A4T0FV10_9BASI|nr:hypothetical protein E3P99_00993 [Wallemia hederae]
MSILSTHRLIGKNVLITGASSGIGAATALLYAKAGANVVLAARRLDRLEVLVNEARSLNAGGVYEAITLDVSRIDDVKEVFNRTTFPHFDILVNNAGLVKGLESVGDIDDADIELMYATNVTGLIKLTQLFVNHFKQRNQGHVVTIGSIAGIEPYANGSIYCSTKHAVRAFTTSLAKELVATPIRVTEIQPGLVETEFSQVRFRGDKEKADNVYKDLDPLTPDDIAQDIIFATSRPPHVQVASSLVFPTNQAGAGIVARPGKSSN